MFNVRSNLKTFVKNHLWRFGYDMQVLEFTGRGQSLARRLIAETGANLVIDVGANEGQFALEVMGYGWNLEVISFEPLMEQHAIMKRASQGYPNWKVHDRIAVGAKVGEAVLHVSKIRVSSLMREMLKACSDAAPDAAYESTQTVKVSTLDDLLGASLKRDAKIFLKIDTQGSEKDVLEGASRVLQNVVGIQMELSLEPLYEDQLLMRDWMSLLKSLGFHPYAFSNGFRDPRTKRLLQCDGFFIRT